MLKKIILAATATAALSLAVVPSAFAAAPWNGGGYNNSGNWNNDGNYPHQPPQQCTPVTQTFHWWDRWGQMHSYTKVVGQRCMPVLPPPPPPPPHHPPFYPHGWGWGWHNW